MSLPDHGQDADGSTSVHEDNTVHIADHAQEHPLLVHIAKKKSLPTGNVKPLLSPSANKPTTQLQEVNLNGIVYRQVNTILNMYGC